MEKIIAVGDVHGSLKQLDEMLLMVMEYPGHRLVFLGDYIDRGPDLEGVCWRLSSLAASIDFSRWQGCR